MRISFAATAVAALGALFLANASLHAQETLPSPQSVPALLKAAQQNDPVAQNNLAVMYATGTGVKQDYVEAAKWYERAAEQGYAVAQFNLANMYEYGFGVPQDRAAALVWYELAAVQGDPWAQYNLGRLQSTSADQAINAYRWLYLATQSGDKEVVQLAAPALKELGGRMTSAQMTEAMRSAVAWRAQQK